MRTKYIPAIIMLTAGAFVSIISLIMKFELLYTLELLLVVLIVFYILGIIAKVIIVKTITQSPKVEDDEESEISEDEEENLQSENKKIV